MNHALALFSLVFSLFIYYVIFKVIKDGSYTVHR